MLFDQVSAVLIPTEQRLLDGYMGNFRVECIPYPIPGWKISLLYTWYIVYALNQSYLLHDHKFQALWDQLILVCVCTKCF